jgi:hypothetical protein
MTRRALALPARPLVGAILVVGTFGTLFLRSFSIFNFGGKNILLAGISLSLLIGVLLLQATKASISGRLRLGFWHGAVFAFLGIMLVCGAMRYGASKALADSRYFMWMAWGYLVFELVRARSAHVRYQSRTLQTAGILTIAYTFFCMAAGIGVKQLTTGGFRYVEEDALFYIAVVFFFSVARMIQQRRFSPMGMIMLVPAIFLILTSAKRAVWGGVMLGMLAQITVTRLSPRKLIGLALVALVACGAMFKLSASSRDILRNRLAVVTKGKITDPSIFFRFAAWKKVADAGLRNPFMPGGVGSNFDFELKVLGLNQKFEDVSPHNTIMWVFYKLGVVGLFFYFRLLFLTFRRARWLVRRMRAAPDPEDRVVSTVLLSLFLYGTFASMFWDYFAIASMGIIYWWVLGAVNGWFFAVRNADARASAEPVPA